MRGGGWQVLVIEDSDDDARLIERELGKTGSLQVLEVVDTEPTLLVALGAQPWDIVLCDYNMPELDALRALELIRATDPYVPFLVVSGSIGEDATVKIIRAGAQTYVSKERLRVLGETVRTEIERAAARATSRRTLRAREDELSDFLDNASDLILTCDFEGNIKYTNRRWKLTLGRDGEQQPTNVYELVRPSSRPALLATLEQVRTTAAGNRVDLEFLGPDGAAVWLEGSLNCRRPRGEAGLVRGIWRDITDRKRAAERELRLEKQLHEAQKMDAIGRLAGGVAHDFNNLLTVIFCSTQCVQDQLPVESELRDELSHVVDAAQRARDLTAQLLTFSSGGQVEPQQLDIGAIIGRLGGMLQRVLGDDVRLDLDVPQSLPRVAANVAQIEQVIVNLAVNGRDAMQDGGRLLIRATLDECGDVANGGNEPGFVRVQVRDTGSGMSAKTVARAFEPFYTTKPTGKGTGLGLSTVYGIVTNARGTVWIDSVLGEGTTVTTRWPLASGTQTTQVEPVRPDQGAAKLRAAVILVVDDEPAVRRVVTHALLQDGHEVLTAGSAAAAVALAQQHGAVDLLVSDVVMPGGSGRDLAAQLRIGRPSLKVLFISGHLPQDDMLSSVLGDEFSRLLNKPFSPKRLRHVVREQLGEPSEADSVSPTGGVGSGPMAKTGPMVKTGPAGRRG